MSSCASYAGGFFDADLIEHSTLPSFGNCSDWENTIGGSLLSASHDENDDDGDGGNNDRLID